MDILTPVTSQKENFHPEDVMNLCYYDVTVLPILYPVSTARCILPGGPIRCFFLCFFTCPVNISAFFTYSVVLPSEYFCCSLPARWIILMLTCPLNNSDFFTCPVGLQFAADWTVLFDL